MEVCCFSPTRAFLLCLVLVTIGLFACKSGAPEPQAKEEAPQQMDVKFTLMEPAATGVNFVNEMKEDYEYNNFSFANLYNGSGVAVGDVNGDGLPDIYFSSTRYVNRLYLNQGNFKFTDVSKAAGVDVGGDIKTGVSMADVNGDGLMDIYLCRTSKSDNGKKSDQLFINKGNQVINGIQVPVFEDQAKAMGIDDNSNTNTNCFFDYDRDGDLDLFLVCHKLGAQKANELRLQQNENGTLKRLTHPETIWESNRLYRNDNGKFTDVTEKAGVVSSAFGLGVVPADFNQDGWLDLYVTNDYVEPDYIYINNKDGTFTDHYHDFLRHSSQSSMGADVADFNNDGLVDIMVLDMKPEDPVRYKMLIHNMVYDRYNLLVQHGYGRQQGRNVLQLNNGNQTFSEIGQFAGVSMTDWSWGILMADFDNDGWKDMYVSNGYRKDVTQLDYLNYFRDSIKSVRELTAQNYPDINEFIKFLPETKIPGYLYINDKNLKFKNATRAAGMDQLSFSNGCAYADFDADGDLDIVVNNMNDPAFLYRNDSRKQHWLQIDLQGPKMNIDAIGATADVYAGGLHQYQMMNTSKGFYSSSEAILHFGLGEATTVDSIILHWPDGSAEKMDMVAADQRLVWKKGDGKPYKAPAKPNSVVLFVNCFPLKEKMLMGIHSPAMITSGFPSLSRSPVSKSVIMPSSSKSLNTSAVTSTNVPLSFRSK